MTTRQLDERPSGPTLDALTALWQTTRVDLAGNLDLLTRKATDLEGALQRLSTLRETWSQTLADARASRAPAPVIERIDATIAAIDQSVARLQKQRAATLVLQDRLAQQMGSGEAVLVRIGDLRQGLAGRLFVRDRPPVWHIEPLRRDLAELPDRVRDTLTADVAQIRQGVSDQRWRLAGQIVLLAAAGADHDRCPATRARMGGGRRRRDGSSRLRAAHCRRGPSHPPYLRLVLLAASATSGHDDRAGAGGAARDADHPSSGGSHPFGGGSTYSAACS